jgi:hypothetical protein
METLFVVAVVLITLAIIVQAGALVAMYLMSRKLVENVNDLMNDSRRLLMPLESAASNLKAVSEDVVEVEKMARRAVMQPVRQCSAIVGGIAEGVRTFVRGKTRPASQNERKHPAA